MMLSAASPRSASLSMQAAMRRWVRRGYSIRSTAPSAMATSLRISQFRLASSRAIDVSFKPLTGGCFSGRDDPHGAARRAAVVPSSSASCLCLPFWFRLQYRCVVSQPAHSS